MALVIPSTKLHQSEILIAKDVNRLVDEKIKVAKKKNVKDAPFADIVGEIMDVELITTSRNCGGYYSIEKNIIALKETDFNPKDVWYVHSLTKEKLEYTDYQKIVLCHEMGHAIQAQLEKFEKGDNVISWMLKLEWEAESIAHKFYNAVFGKLPAHWFNAYFKKEDVDYLINWHSCWLDNDVL